MNWAFNPDVLLFFIMPSPVAYYIKVQSSENIFIPKVIYPKVIIPLWIGIT
jgi:hypothetical protein